MSSSPRRPKMPPPPAPLATPLMIEETEEAKKKARKRPLGRPSTILAGRLMSKQGKTLLGE